MKVLVTGATGFVGSELIKHLLAEELDIIATVRADDSVLPSDVKPFVVGDFAELIDWSLDLLAVDVIIHCAARAHITNDFSSASQTEYRKVNTDGTLRLARQAADTGVKRFIFISSIKVNGELSMVERPFQPDDTYMPLEPYGLSKYEAEQGLLTIAKETGMEVVIIRSPLVYGPNVKANFRSVVKWVDKVGVLPFGAIHNQRSLVALDNLVSFIIDCIDHPKAANEIFLISDGEDVSTTTLLQKVAKALGKKSRLLPIPVWLMRAVARLLGKGDVANRLFGSLQVDSSKARTLLGWKPVITMDEQLKKTVEAYLNEKTV